MRAALPCLPGPVMDWGQGLHFVGHQCLTAPWDTLAVPWGTPSTCNPGEEDAIRRRREGAGRGRLRATASPLCSIKHSGGGGGGGRRGNCNLRAGGRWEFQQFPGRGDAPCHHGTARPYE